MILNGQKIEPERLYTPAEWAVISDRTVKTLAKNRTLRAGEPFLKIGRAVYYRGSDILTHIEKHLHPTGREAAVQHARATGLKRAA